ncbi:C40 family peptidase [uncultured Planococcus sp.]|uniref:C40 family peptidase n=1 Tax=Planococcus donghaensis TaxID=414778 RepID=UPI0026329FDB|nr:C40 family peptidase [uncultured Planococcus sp.]
MKNRILLIMMMVLLFSVISPFTATETKAAAPDDIASYALKFKGTPYKFGGTTTAGFDCSGYILHVFKNFDISLPRTSAEQFNVGTSVSKSNLQKGDLVFFANTYKPGISHTGIYLGDGDVISAESKGVAISNINTNPYWGPKYAGAKRLSGVKSVTAPIQASLPPVTNGNFVDVASSHPAYEAIKSLNVSGIINGFEKQDFRPNESITRGQAAAMVNRVLELQPSGAVNFSDVSTSHRFAKDIAAMNESGIILGYTNGAYGVDDTLTKTQLAVILERAFKMSESTQAQAKTSSVKYLDIPSTFWAHKHIVTLKAIDQTTVFQTSRYYETKNANRSEFAAALYSSMMVK